MKRKFFGSLGKVDVKVLHLIDSEGLYGAEIVLLSLVKEQLEQGLSPLILSAGTLGQEEKPLEIEARKRGLPVKAWRMKPGLNLKGMKQIIDFSGEHKFDLLHSHGYKFNVLIALQSKKARRMPWIVTMHGYLQHPFPSKGWFYNSLDRLLISRADGIAVVSEKLIKSLILKPKNLLLEVISNGVVFSDQTVTSLLDPEIESFFDSKSQVVIVVGRLSYEKGLDILLKTMLPLLVEKQDVGLLILGEGPERRFIESFVDDNALAAQVFIAGYRRNAVAYIKRSDLLVIPSRTEGLPITLLEAMTVEVPVVATNVGAIPIVLNDGEFGALIEAGDYQGLQVAIEAALVDEKGSRQRALRAKEVVKMRYSMYETANKYRKLYQRVVSF